ncbi:MAG: phosphoribosylglycinamide formyltransferase [Polyangiaceae bacterium]|nr:phosphoribosylglycinamide formyltransferase [Polyangiaceae bacterium]
MSTLDLGVLISGRGSNLLSILHAIGAERLDARVRLVLSNRADAGGLVHAKARGVHTAVLSHRDYASREAYDEALVATLREAGVTWVVLAGFMRIVTPVFLNAFPGRVINIHPSLLPAFPGVHSQAQALQYGVKIAGCTVHFVDSGTDTGPIISQTAVSVLDDDTEETLSARILSAEHTLLPRVLQWIAQGRVTLVPADENRRARVVIHQEE